VLDLFNTKIFFRNTDPNTTSWISKVLGEDEIREHMENLSYGANTIRDGVYLSQQTKTKPLALPIEIASLPDLEAYIKLPASVPTGRIKVQYLDVENMADGFVVKTVNVVNLDTKSIVAEAASDKVYLHYKATCW
jgi:type IV secretory pathway TraG/TraD family ATPase VirD4